MVNDNLFHEMHYWMLEGREGSLRKLGNSFGLERSDEDAGWALPDMQAMFGSPLSRADMIEGYEGSLDGKRDRWLMIFGDGRGAVLVY